jgi:hypothetical protein
MSFPRKWESRTNRNYWTPAPVPYRVFAGVTNWELLEVHKNHYYHKLIFWVVNCGSSNMDETNKDSTEISCEKLPVTSRGNELASQISSSTNL